MSVSAIENLTGMQATKQKQQSPDALRQAAEQFEAVLLMQLTASLNGTGDASGEDALFGGDGGTDLAKKMFSEQLATSMAQAGGIGLADMIMQKISGNNPPLTDKMKSLSGAVSAVRDIKENAGADNFQPENKVSPSRNNAIKSVSISSANLNYDPNEAQIISTFADDIANQTADDDFKPLTLDGKMLNSTRPRIVPEYAISRSEPIVADTMNYALKTAEKVEFQMPVEGRISSNFGTRFHPVDKKTKFHGGIDIAVPTGTPIGAAAEGTVKFAGWKGGYGNSVIIKHADGSETLYAHNQKLLVAEGQQIHAGERISLSGSTGKSTGPHLHFEVRQNGQVVNPRNFLSNVLPKNADR